jgi:hypothetical protein
MYDFSAVKKFLREPDRSLLRQEVGKAAALSVAQVLQLNVRALTGAGLVTRGWSGHCEGFCTFRAGDHGIISLVRKSCTRVHFRRG